MFALVTGVQTCALPISTHDFDWIRRNIPQGMNAQLFDVTSANAVLSLMGPKARDILQAVTRDDVSNEAFRFGAARRIGTAIGRAACRIREGPDVERSVFPGSF